MAENWTNTDIKNGISEVTLNSWNDFSEFIDTEMLDFRNYIYRGHKTEEWLLEPTLNRLAKSKTKANLKEVRDEHIQKFRYALRGRIKDSVKYKNDDELWALGQHNGLATPLLDWTSSPYVAAYFSLIEPREKKGYSLVYTIDENAINSFNDLEIVNPITDENTRLINQSGLFVKVLTNQDIEKMFRRKFKDVTTIYKMIKIKIPNNDREIALRSLNRMNINHNTLFPDIQGASIHCNNEIQIDKY
ncbi:FRG domain-containing protein [Maribacter sp. HTCC2170]|uniref:FRG domain-containing protein n=1 Tax=Maribacter sp. (strain HTCC2170 / KCCM 42371) TaxID=313603 RepID=UPI00006B47CE|nr:FRG domain-containing protein [Maribacter sp. HTCC2170]EAR01978.1 hypothetical protein FB2170_15658 [Maribacter sp. HTCC2170]